MGKTVWLHMLAMLIGLITLWVVAEGMNNSPTLHVDAYLPTYVPPAQGVSGKVRLAGTVETLHLARAWAVALQAQLPGLQVQSVETSVTPVLWQLTDEPTVAVLGERMSETAVTAFEQHFGYRPTRLRVAWNAIAIVVHRDNPVATRRFTVAELDALFSTTRLRGHTNVQYWRDLGLQGWWSQQPISLYGHDASTSLYATFQQRALGGGTFKPEVVPQPSSAAVVYAVGRHLNAIGYTGISFLTPAVAVVPLAVHPWQTAVSPTPGSILAQQYPLTLEVNLYLYWPPGSILTAPLREMLRFLYSRQGQLIVAAHGYVPLPAAMATQVLQSLGLAVNQQRP